MSSVSRRRFISGLFLAGATTQLSARALASDGTATAWDPSTGYAAGSRVSYRGQTWRAKQPAGPGQYPQGVGDGSRADRDLLLAQRNGFAQRVTGGDAGDTYVVTSTADTKTRGTLRYALMRPEPLWIVFDKALGPNVTIALTSKLKPLANKTVDGRGVNVRITGSYDINIKGLGVANQIWCYIERVVSPVTAPLGGIHGFTIDGVPNKGDVGGLDLIWLHHITFGQTGDSVLSIGKAASSRPSRLTIDWCRFGLQPDVDAWLYAYNARTLGQDNSAENGKSAAVGLDPQDGQWPDAIQATWHHNHFEGAVQRIIKVQRARAHFYNNLVDRWAQPPLVVQPNDAKNHPDAVAYANTYQSGAKQSTIRPNYNSSATEIANDGELLSQNNVYVPYALNEEHLLSPALVAAGYLKSPWLITLPRKQAAVIVAKSAKAPTSLVKSTGNWSPDRDAVGLDLQSNPDLVFTGVTFASTEDPYNVLPNGQTRQAGDDWRNDAPYGYALEVAGVGLQREIAAAAGNDQVWVRD